MKVLIYLLNKNKLKGKRVVALAELLYNKNGTITTSNTNHLNSAYALREFLPVKIERVDYSSDHIISIGV